MSDMDGNAVPGFKRADMRPCGYQVEKIRTVGKSTPAEMVHTTIYNTYIQRFSTTAGWEVGCPKCLSFWCPMSVQSLYDSRLEVVLLLVSSLHGVQRQLK